MVARRCGLTAMTVTRALRPGASVAPGTRAKVLKVVQELGYHPQPNMGRPRHGVPPRRHAVEVILGHHMTSDFYLALLSSIEHELAVRGLDCIIRSASADLERFIGLCECLRADRSVPTLVVGYLPTRQLEVLLEVRPNAVLVDHTGDPSVRVPYRSIGFDNVEAARLVTRHLLEAGRRRILLVSGFRGHYFSREIAQGYREALAEHGAGVDPALVVETDFTMAQAALRIAEALDRGLAFDAVLTNDQMAVAVLGTLARRGRRVPDDVAIAGLDGLPIGEFIVPSLTTARLDYALLGQLAVTCVCDEKTARSPVRQRILPELVVRESTQESTQGVRTCPT